LIIAPNGHYVYILLDQETPFYVGKGSGKRAFDHIQPANLAKDPNTFKQRKIQKMIREGRQIHYKFFKCVSDKEASLLEKQLIAGFGRRGIDDNGILTNRAEGGTGGNTMTPEQLKENGRKHSEWWNSLSETEKQEMKERAKEGKIRNGVYRKPSDWTLSLSNKKRMQQFNVKSRKQVEQLDEYGNILAKFESAHDASKATGASQGSISNVCLGRHQKAKGFRWRYC